MKKRLFDRGLYVDALRQLKFIGAAGTLLLSLEAVLIPIGCLVQFSQGHVTAGITALSAMEMHPLLILCFLVLAPLMVLYLFQFLNKRSPATFITPSPTAAFPCFSAFLPRC